MAKRRIAGKGEAKNGKGIRPKRRWHDDLKPATKKSVFAIIFFALALITILAYWGRAGLLGNGIYRSLELAVGKAYFLAPLTLIVIGASLLFSIRRHLFATSFIGGGIFFLSGLALVELFFKNKTGGWVGFLANWPLERILDFWAALVVETTILIASILIIANIPLWRPHKEEEGEMGDADEAITTDSSTQETAAKRILDSVVDAASAVTAIAKRDDGGAARGSSKVMVDTADPKRSDDPDVFSVSKNRAKTSHYILPPLSLLSDDKGTPSSGDIRANANIIKRTLLNFGIDVEMGEVSIGPTVTQYTLKPAEGMKLARIVALHNDLSLALAAHPIRIEAPIPGKSLVGIEVPNRSIALVGLRSLIDSNVFQQTSASLLFALGRDVAGTPVYANLGKMPHLLVAGATGSGKSVCIHSLMTSLLYRNTPDMLKFLIIDPKRVELSAYTGIPHLLAPPITDPKKTIQALRWAVKEMERRYEVLSESGVRDLASYNERVTKNNSATEELMPYLVIVIDELADLVMSFPREVEGSVVRIAQMARAVGIHLVVATQRPSVEVITGLIKANITSRIAFQVASQIDSRTILDTSGAEKLLGNGDMLFLAGDTAKPRRIQGGFVSESEVHKITSFIRDQAETVMPETGESDIFATAQNSLASAMSSNEDFEGDEDPLYEDARETVIEAGKASASYLQRRLKVGYARAARLLDILEERGVIGPGDGAKPREILERPESSET